MGGTTAWNLGNLAGTHDLVEVCRLLHEAVARQMDATIFFLGLYDAASQTVEVVWQVENGEELSGGSFPLGKGLTSQVILTGSSRLIRHWTAEGPRVQVQYATGTPGLPESAIAVPLKLAGHTIGLLCVESYSQNAYADEELAFLLGAYASTSRSRGVNCETSLSAPERISASSAAPSLVALDGGAHGSMSSTGVTTGP